MNTVIAREPQFLNFKGCDWHTMAVNESKVDGGEKVNTSIKYVSASPCGMHSFQSRITTNRYKDHGSVLTIWANILDPLFPRVVLTVLATRSRLSVMRYTVLKDRNSEAWLSSGTGCATWVLATPLCHSIA